jgi:hypothetical protein
MAFVMGEYLRVVIHRGVARVRVLAGLIAIDAWLDTLGLWSLVCGYRELLSLETRDFRLEAE